ncbi:MAG: flagellar biosynthetic protein FliQ [Gemmataceae bacterium]|nr:flagellar biosynthetic protein FliQ [Gemmataceae bacterium]MDW8241979.1 flagellar biosynthetic protein FliQ [Thermogemmata sp.]
MTVEFIIRLMQELFFIALVVSFPALIVSLIVGLVVSIFQTITSIQDQTLSYVPRIILVGLTIVVTMGFTLQQAAEFARRMILTAVSLSH